MATTIYGEITSAQLAGSGGGGSSSAAVVGPFAAANTANGNPGLGGFSGYGYAVIGAGSLIAATVTLASGQAGTTSIAVYKNGALLVTLFNGISFTTAAKYFTVSFASGTYTAVANDIYTIVVTASSTAYTVAINLVLTNP